MTLGGTRIDHLRLDVRNLHAQAGQPSGAVVAAPVKVRAVIAQDVIAAVVTRRTPRIVLELRAGGVARATLVGHDGWGHVDLVPRVDGRTLVLAPRSLALRARHLFNVARRLPPYRVTLSGSFPEAHITGVTVEDGQIVLNGVYEEWRWPLGPQSLDELLTQIKRFEGGAIRLPTP